ncbi:FAD-dependent oxidoreductase [Luteolibacter marinus]|uniref:FAD-dependent oxidoreductase n=1 Tax=Luteolibacter marinus TaxID=2776705 RepID=UPI001868046D
MNQDKDRVVILGGGVIGLCTAYYALKRGLRVTVVQREEEGGDNCSMGNAGMIVPSHFIPLAAPGMIPKGLRWMFNRESPFYVRPRLDSALIRWAWLFHRSSTDRHVAASRELLRDLNLESRRLFVELGGDDDFGMEQRGMLMLCKSAKGLEEEAAVAEAAREIGIDAEVLDAAGVARLDPSVTMDLAGAVHFPQDCHLDPARFMRSMRRRVADLGGELVSGIEIESVEMSQGKVAALAGGGHRFSGGQFVFAGGSWTPGLLRQLGLKLPLQAGKGYSLTLSGPPELPRCCSIFVEAKVAVTPMGGRLRFAGTMEVGGLDLSVDPARVRGIVKSVNSYFPKFNESDFEGVQPWAGLRPVSPDGIPYLGKVPGVENAIAATGHAMMGLSLGPVTGSLATGLLTGDVPFRSIEAMAPGRFS